MTDFYYSPFPNWVLGDMFYNGMTEEDFRKDASEAHYLHMCGKLHIRRVEERYFCVEYLDSDEYPKEREVYAQIVEAVKPYLNSILSDCYPFNIEFAEDSVDVKLDFNSDYADRYYDKYDVALTGEPPIGHVVATYAEIADLVKERIESTFVNAL